MQFWSLRCQLDEGGKRAFVAIEMRIEHRAGFDDWDIFLGDKRQSSGISARISYAPYTAAKRTCKRHLRFMTLTLFAPLSLAAMTQTRRSSFNAPGANA